jgi:hypothetical protein
LSFGFDYRRQEEQHASEGTDEKESILSKEGRKGERDQEEGRKEGLKG